MALISSVSDSLQLISAKKPACTKSCPDNPTNKVSNLLMNTMEYLAAKEPELPSETIESLKYVIFGVFAG